ncbi:TIGR03118 family protein [Noviherbaspirillum autotrophicum]|uniref:TIGR03118 family protein n=1 Tax=Noviherbaspirillum autotrophicum TaxID=709839 RepID=UPI000B1B94A0|nr:TIGR03118 family protein [Noviherbaspirillum autotrophicum]
MDTRRHRNVARFLCVLGMLTTINMVPSAQATGTQATSTQATGNFYQQHNLVSDGANPADNTDPNLINSWGIAFNPFGPVWVADNGTGVSTLYDGNGKPQSLVVQIPSPANGSGSGTPTGIVFNASTGFVVSQGSASGASKFIFATEDGVIAAWAPNVDATHAIRMVDNSVATGAVYKGLALSANGDGNLLYAADFHNNRIDVFDSSFKPVTLPAGAFSDPNLPYGFAPFGLQAIGGDIYVSYAKQDAAKHDDVAGVGLGFIDVYDPNGTLLKRLVSQGSLNSPWGMALAPAGFGKFSGRLLVGNFGDGLIHAYDIATGDSAGTLKDAGMRPIQIDGLWGLAFGNGFDKQPVNTLFFTAGPGDEKQGLYGRIDVAPDAGQDSGP